MMSVAEALDRASKMYPNAKITGDQLTIYIEELADLPAGVVVQAITECMRTSTFFPALAEIRNRVTAIAGESVLVDAESAWGEVMQEVKRVGYQRYANGEELKFSSPMIGRAVESIGWRDICLTDISQLGTLRAQFRDALRAIQRREVDRVVSGRHGVTEAIGEGPQPAKRDGLKSIGELVTLHEWKDNGHEN